MLTEVLLLECEPTCITNTEYYILYVIPSIGIYSINIKQYMLYKFIKFYCANVYSLPKGNILSR